MGGLKAGRIALSALVAALLGACGGGGGGGGGGMLPPPPATPISPPPPAAAFPPLAPPHANGDFPAPASAEFTANWGVAGVNAQIAWQNGATGAGVMVAVIDDGIDPNHVELAGRISPNSTDIVAGRNALTTTQSHGSELSSLIAGNYNGGQTVGVAFDATILAVRADNGSGNFNYSDLTSAIDYARTNGARIINFSLGGGGAPPQSFLDAVQRATQAGIIFAVSAGNDGQVGAVEPNYPGLLAINNAVSNGLIIVAGGLNANGTLNTVSNPPGSAQAFYLTAPGWEIIVPDHGPVGPVPGFQTCGLGPGGNLCQIQGTSYASPHVSGAAALVMDGFPGLTSAQVVNLLLTTADDTGAPGTDAVMGRGRLNVGRAFQPVGPLAAPLGSGLITQQSVLGAVGPAFGDGLTQNAAAWTVTGFDAFDRSFPINLAGAWRNADAGPSTVAQAPLLWRTARDETGAVMHRSRRLRASRPRRCGCRSRARSSNSPPCASRRRSPWGSRPASPHMARAPTPSMTTRRVTSAW